MLSHSPVSPLPSLLLPTMAGPGGKPSLLVLFLILVTATHPASATSPHLGVLCTACATCCNPTQPSLPPPPPPRAAVQSPPPPASLVPVPYYSYPPPPPGSGYVYPPPTLPYFIAPPPPNPLLPYYPYYPKTRGPPNNRPSPWSSGHRLHSESSSLRSLASVVAVLSLLHLLR